MTDDSVKFVGSEDCTYRDFTNAFLKYDANHSVEKKLCDYLNLDPNGVIMKKLTWLGIFEDKKIGLKDASPAQVLQKLLESKWSLGPEDKDILVMQHKFEYELNGEKKGIQSSFAYIGKTQAETAMAITVGTPLAIATRMLATGKIKLKGVQIPVVSELYNPILDELEDYGIKFTEEEFEVK
jgi:saccharopine dehydrogenase (NADP+, L-glutamate forming)